MTEKQQLPDPLVPAEVDLRGYEFMPFYGDRCFGSESWIKASPEAKIAMLKLWWRAFAKELPAGSLPNDDVLICQYAGYEANPKAWRKLRDQAIAGFTQCSDGRLYHKVVGPIAIEAWEFRNKQRDRTKNARDARLSKRLLQSDPKHVNESVTGSTGQDRIGQDTAAFTTEGKGKGYPQPPRKAAAAAELIYPEKLTAAQRNEAASLLSGHPRAQDMLDELEAKGRVERVNSPIGFLIRLKEQCDSGNFNAERAAAVQVEREGAKARKELEAAGRTSTGQRQPA